MGANDRDNPDDEPGAHDRQLPKGFPPALAKALTDVFTYAVGLSNGVNFLFTHATLSEDGEWVSLLGVQRLNESVINTGSGPASFDRGVDVRVSAIVWAADAPWGS